MSEGFASKKVQSALSRLYPSLSKAASQGLGQGAGPAFSSDWSLSAEEGSVSIPYTTIFDVKVTCPGAVVSSPIEEGSFASYNKQADPLEISCSLGVQGGEDVMAAALEALDKLQGSFGKLTLGTPAATYDNLTLESYDYSRSASGGARLLTAELKLVEVREVETEVTTTAVPMTEESTKNPGSASKSSKGKAGAAETGEPKKSGEKKNQSGLKSLISGGKKKE
jgi:hypothetical protein